MKTSWLLTNEKTGTKRMPKHHILCALSGCFDSVFPSAWCFYSANIIRQSNLWLKHPVAVVHCKIHFIIAISIQLAFLSSFSQSQLVNDFLFQLLNRNSSRICLWLCITFYEWRFFVSLGFTTRMLSFDNE